MTDQTDVRWIAGFWRRIGAFAIDSIILGVAGIVLGLFLKEQFVQIGGWGRLVGFVIASTYFGMLNSKLFDGQTVGKNFLDLRVVGADNQTIDVTRSFARYSVIGVPFFLNGVPFTDDAATTYWLYPLSLVIFGGIFSVVYLYLFNRDTRQSLHDLVVGTYVINTGVERQAAKDLWRPHLIVVGIIFAVSALLPAYTSKMIQTEPFQGLFSAQSALLRNSAVNRVVVSSGNSTRLSSGVDAQTTTYLSARAFLNLDSVSDAELAEQLAIVLVRSYPESESVDAVQIVLTYGYDIGIASSWASHSYPFEPGDLLSDESAIE